LTVKLTGWLVDTVTGNESPVMANSVGFVPPRPTEDTTTLAPVAFSVAVLVPLVPTVTLPALMVVGVTLNCPVCAVADPLKEMVRVGLEPLELMVTLPL